MTNNDDRRWHGRRLSPEEFGRRLFQALSDLDVRIVWFLGAGCSISSGIPGAGDLVKSWLPQLKEIRTGLRDGWEEFADVTYPGWREGPSIHYGSVIEELFESEEDRQREIERLTGGKDPGFGYAALAQMMSHPKLGPRSNVAITVNFDDLVADSLYLYTAKKPLVIGHEVLTRFIRRGDQRPLVVKVHGDARLAPKNTTDETSRLDAELILAIRRLCARARVVMVGYAGADESIAPIFVEDGGEPGPEVIYWVNESPPAAPLLTSFEQIQTRVSWVGHGDFDSLMVELHACFGLGRPNFERLETLQKAYESTLSRLRVSERKGASGSGDRAPVVEGLLDELKASRLVTQARLLEDSEPRRADELYREALTADPENDYGLNAYALFLENSNKLDQAEEIYDRAAKKASAWGVTLSNYALFLEDHRHDPGRAKALYEQALKMNPDSSIILNNYAVFLARYERDLDRAQDLFETAITTDHTSAASLSNYATFLHDRQGDSDRIRDLYEMALTIDPGHQITLSHFAGYLYLHSELEAAREMHQRARHSLESGDRKAITPHMARRINAQLWFYLLCYEPTRRGEAIRQMRNDLLEGGSPRTGAVLVHAKAARENLNPDAELIEAAARAISEPSEVEAFLAMTE